MGTLIELPKKVRINGNYDTKEVWINGIKLNIRKSQKVWNHSLDFNWGYGGSGPAQLALAVMMEFFPKDEAVHLHQHFKREVIAALPERDFEIEIDINKWKDALDKGSEVQHG